MQGERGFLNVVVIRASLHSGSTLELDIGEVRTLAAQARISERVGPLSALDEDAGAPCSGERLACTNGLERIESAFDSQPPPSVRRTDVRDVVRSGVHAVHVDFDSGPEATPRANGTLSVSYEEKIIRINGDSVRLTRTEFRLLAH